MQFHGHGHTSVLRVRARWIARWRKTLSLTLGLFILTGVASTQARTPRPVQHMVDRFVKQNALKDLHVGVAIALASDGRVVASHLADQRMNPASGTKLLTTVAALKRWAPTTRWVTRIVGHGGKDGRVNHLTIVGGGDPKLLIKDIRKWGRVLKAKGLRVVENGIVLDASTFDRVNLPPAYGQKQTASGYRASIGALGSEFAAFKITLRPGKGPGEKVTYRRQPITRGVVIRNRARTVEGQESTLRLSLSSTPSGQTRLLIEGTMGLKAKTFVRRIRVLDANFYTAYLLKDVLKRLGIKVKGTIRYGKREGGTELLAYPSRPLIHHLRDINTYSNNYMAETVFKQLGRLNEQTPASWAHAQQTVTRLLGELGVPAASFNVVNGSGLYKATTISPRGMVQLLDVAGRSKKWGGAFKSTLAVSGRSGSLKFRLRGSMRGRVLGKTGTLDDVVSLSGYLRGRRHQWIFSILVNRATAERTERIRKAVDQFLRRLAKR